MSYEQFMLIRAGRKKVGTPTALNAVGASTSSARSLLLPSSDSRVVHFNTSTGNDSTGDGSQGNPYATYSKCVNEINASGGSLTTIESQTNATITDDITKPTQFSVGVIGSVTYSADLDQFTTGGITNPGIGSNEAVATDGNGKWIMAVNGASAALWESTDNGANWSEISQSVLDNAAGIAYAGGTWVATGNGSFSIARSTDGVTWTGSSTVTIGGPVSGDGSGNWVAAITGSSTVISSDDGLTWSTSSDVTNITTAVSDITNDESGNWVAVGFTGMIVLSTDNGDTWQLPTTNPASGLIFAVETDKSGNWICFDGGTGYSSTDNGDTWATVSTSPSGATQLRDIATDGTDWVCTSGSNQMYYSSDSGDTWTQSTTTGFSGSNPLRAVETDGNGNWVVGGAGPSLGNETSYSLAVDASADLCGVSFGNYVAINNDVKYLACTFEVVEPVALELNADATIDECKIKSDNSDCITGSSNAFTITNSLIIQDSTSLESIDITTVPTSDSDVKINQNTIIGDISFSNTSMVANGIQMRDNIIEGDITATESTNLFEIESGNIRGSVTNANVNGRVTSVDPFFVDSTTDDYRLQRETGYSDTDTFTVDSALIRASVFSTTPEGIARDLGAYNFDDSNTTFIFQRNIMFPKPVDQGQIQFTRQHEANLQIGLSGEPDVFNQPDRITEILTIKYRHLTFSENDRQYGAFLEYLEGLNDTRVFLALFPDQQIELPSLTVNGNQSAGTPTVDINSANLFGGEIIDIANKTYYIIYFTPQPGPATTIVLDRPLEDDVLNNDTITVRYSKLSGEFVYIPQRQKSWSINSQIDTVYQSGITIQFARKVDNGS